MSKANENKENHTEEPAPPAQKVKHTNPGLRAVLGIIAIILIVIFSNLLIRSTSLGNKNIDLTEDNRYTLTEGTKAILSELKHPVIIRYYATRDSKAMPRRVKNYMRTVDDLLVRYKNLSNGKIRIEHLDPQPDTDAEDSAALDGINGERINDENLYFGIAIACLDQQTTLPFLDPNNETMLEYNLSSAIANVSTFEKPTIGLMTGLDLAGLPPEQPGQAPTPPWAIYTLLQQRYHVTSLPMNVTEIDPEKISVLLVIHPTGISKATEYAIDQFLLKGGVVVACLDSFALTAPGGNQIVMGGQYSSSLPSLLTAWGLGMDSTSVIADGKYATDFGAGGPNSRRMFSHLSLTTDAFNSEDEIITQGFENLYFPLAGGFTINSDSGIKTEALVKSSSEVILVSGEEATKPEPGLFSRKSPSGKQYNLVMRLRGMFNTAFPDGSPNNNKDTTSENTNEPTPLKKATEEGTVYLISDADFLYDRACFQKTGQGYIAINNNAALLQNILDQCTGSKHLIGSRSRSATTRPFTIIKEMETDYEREMYGDVKEAEKAMNDIVSQLQQLQDQKGQGKAMILTEEQQTKLTELQEEQIRLRRELREKQKGLQAKKDKLFAKITWMTVGITPAAVALFGLIVWFVRRTRTRAH